MKKAFGLFLFSLIFVPSVFAAENKSITPGQGKQKVQARLTEAKLKVCQTKENNIKKQAEQLTKLVGTMQEKFDSIAKRVEDYYVSKIIPSGKTAPNYDSLVSEIQNKKQATQTTLGKAQTDANSFSCSGNDPKGQMAQFKTDMQAVKAALKDYRTAIKNLIVAVRSRESK